MDRTRTFSRRSALGLGLAALAMPGQARAAAKPAVLVELFTSQGCSSCPPADAILGKLRAEADVYAVSLNVDYWDYLGWRDTLAKPEYSKRQFDYGKSRGDMQVYTPQMVMNGHYHAVGSDETAVRKFIGECQEEGLSVPLTLSVSDKELKVDISAQAHSGEATLWLMAVAPEVTQAIEHGENAGTSNTYFNVVRNMVPAALWKGEDYHGSWMRDAVMPADCTSCIAVLQKDKTGQVIGLARA